MRIADSPLESSKIQKERWLVLLSDPDFICRFFRYCQVDTSSSDKRAGLSKVGRIRRTCKCLLC